MQSPLAPADVLQKANQIKAVAYYKAAYNCARSGHAKEARTYVLYAVRYHKKYLLNIRLWVIAGLSLLGNQLMSKSLSLLLQYFPPGYSISPDKKPASNM